MLCKLSNVIFLIRKILYIFLLFSALVSCSSNAEETTPREFLCLPGKSSEEMADEYMRAYFGTSYSSDRYKSVPIWNQQWGHDFSPKVRESISIETSAGLAADAKSINLDFLNILYFTERLYIDKNYGFRLVFVNKENQLLEYRGDTYLKASNYHRNKVDSFFELPKACDYWYREWTFQDHSVNQLNIYALIDGEKLSDELRLNISSCQTRAFFSHLGFRGIDEIDGSKMVFQNEYGISNLSNYSQWLLWTRFSESSPKLSGKTREQVKTKIRNFFHRNCK